MKLPPQYKSGVAYFMDLELEVNRHTFIPRPETELLVEKAVSLAENLLKEARNVDIYDLCCGSGNIAISLTKYVERSKILASDISHEALLTALRNAGRAGAASRIGFMQADLLSCLKTGAVFDMIVCNPPYINAEDILKLDDEVKAEPYIALFGGQDGAEYYRKIARSAKEHMKKGGYLLFEIGYDQGVTVPEILKASGWSGIEVFKDYSGIDRIITAQYGHADN